MREKSNTFILVVKVIFVIIKYIFIISVLGIYLIFRILTKLAEEI